MYNVDHTIIEAIKNVDVNRTDSIDVKLKSIMKNAIRLIDTCSMKPNLFFDIYF